MSRIYLAAVYDNGGRTFDRYIAEFHHEEADEEFAISIGPTGNAPNGVCMTLDEWYGPEEGDKEVDARELPAPVRKAIANEILLARSGAY